MAYEETYMEFWSSQKKKERIEVREKIDRLTSKTTKVKKIKDRK